MTYYKATRPDGTSFYDSRTRWEVGEATVHPDYRPELGLCSAGVLHAADVPAETLLGGSWPCRLFRVEPEPDGELIGPEGHKWGGPAWRVVEELPPWQALGPNGEEVAALIERASRLSTPEIVALEAARAAARAAAWFAAPGAAWTAARAAALDAARAAALDAARAAAWAAARAAVRAAAPEPPTWEDVPAGASAARSAAHALVVRDVLDPGAFDVLYGPWREAVGG